MNKKDSLSDERLASLHQQKRLNAFFILYRRYKNYGYAIIYQTLEKGHLVNALKDDRDAILYDAIMEALKCFDVNRGTFRKLLSAIIMHQTMNRINEFRKDPLSDYISLDANIKDGANIIFADSLTFADKSATPQEIINITDRVKKVEVNYDGAHKRRVRKMIHLRQEGYTYREIAIRFKTSERAVRAIFYRIRKRIDIKENNKIKK